MNANDYIRTDAEVRILAEEAARPETMNLDFSGQHDFCTRMGLLPAEGSDRDRFSALYDNPQARAIMELIEGLRRAKDRMDSAAKWMRDNLDRNDQRFEGRELHETVSSSDGVARYALDYDTALTEYTVYQERLRRLVNQIREAQGYELDAFTRIENHPKISPAEDQARRALAKLERHLADQKGYGPGMQRTHLRKDHDMRVSTQTGPAPALLHETAHADELAALREQVTRFEDGEPR